MSQDKVTRKHTQFRDLAEEFTTGLRHRVPAHIVPLARPPSNIGRIRLELTRKRKSDDELEDETLEGDNSDHAEERFGEVEAFEEEHHFEERQKHDDRDTVGDGS